MNIIVSIITGGIVGWLAGIIMKSSHSVIINIRLWFLRQYLSSNSGCLLVDCYRKAILKAGIAI